MAVLIDSLREHRLWFHLLLVSFAAGCVDAYAVPPEVQAYFGDCNSGRSSDCIGSSAPVAAPVNKLASAATAGSANAQYELARLFQNDGNVSKAVHWYTAAANQGHAFATYSLAAAYELGIGGRKEYETAIHWYQRYAELNLDDRAIAEQTARKIQELRQSLPQSSPAGTQNRIAVIDEAPTESDRISTESAAKGKKGKGQEANAINGSKRLALVIGNDSYKSVNKLKNARADARAIADNLAAVGFRVTLKEDLNDKEMKAAIRALASQVQGGDEVLFFFSGHGVQLGATNYLLPIDIIGENEAQVRDEALPLQRVLDDMSEQKAKFTLAMIDACRDNPFKSSGRSIGTKGLAPTTAATGQMVIFSAGAGQQALDRLDDSDKNKNGLFTRVFIQEMQRSNASVDRLIRNVREQVAALAKSVGREQVPAIYDQVLGDFYFRK